MISLNCCSAPPWRKSPKICGHHMCRVLEECSLELQRAMSEVEHKEHVSSELPPVCCYQLNHCAEKFCIPLDNAMKVWCCAADAGQIRQETGGAAAARGHLEAN